MRGWVYIITNAAMPGLVKIGFSTKDPDMRAAELSHTGSPLPYVVIYELLIQNPFEIEQKAHTRLRDLREGKEWFRCNAETAVNCVREISEGQGLLERIRFQITEPVAVESEEDLVARDKEINHQEVFRLAKRIHNIKSGNNESGIVLDQLKRFVGPAPDENEINRCMRALSNVVDVPLTTVQTRNIVVAVRSKMTVDAPPADIVKMLENSLIPKLSEKQAWCLFQVLAQETGYATGRDLP